MRLFRRRQPRLRPLGEAEAYERAYGDRTEEVRIVTRVSRVASKPRRARLPGTISGEELRRLFEARLDRRHGGPGERA